MKRLLVTGGAGDWAISFKQAMEGRYDVVSPSRQELDVTNRAAVEQFFCDKAFDIVINNAGTIHPKRILETDDNLWIKDIEVNLIGTFLVSKYALRANNNCTIINISSAAGFSAYADWSSYCSSKAAVNTLTKSLAADGYNAYAICPGGFDTKFRGYFDLDNSNLMGTEVVTNYVMKAIDGEYESGAVIFFRKDDVKVY